MVGDIIEKKYDYEVESNMNSAQVKRNTNVKKLLRIPQWQDIPVCCLLFLASRASVIGVFPFAVSMFCSVFDKSAAYIAMLVVALGAISAGVGFMSIKYILAIIFFWLYTRLRENYKETPVFSSVVCGASMFMGGCILMICDTSVVYAFLTLIIESVTASLMYIVYARALRIFSRRKTKASREEMICGALCAGVFISGFQDINIFNINISRCVISYIVMSIAMSCDVAVAGSGGICTGIICSLNEKATVTLIGFYGLCGMLCSLMKSLKKYGVVLGYLSSGAVILLYVGNSFDIPVSMFEMIITSIVFLCVPEKIHHELSGRVSGIIAPEITSPEEKTTAFIIEKLTRISNSFSVLSDTFKCVSDKRMRKFHREAASIIQETVERVCKNCADCSRCWKEDFGYTWKNTFSLLDTYEKRGFCTVGNVSGEFLNQCIIPENFLAEFNHSYELFRIETIHKGEAVVARDLISEQYTLFSDITKRFAKSIEEGFYIDIDMEEAISDKLAANDIAVRDVRAVYNENIYEIYISTLYSLDPEPVCGMISQYIELPVFFECMQPCGVMKFSTAGVYNISVGVSQESKSGEAVCGDSVFKFKTDDNKYYIMICDGMGSGPAARSESMLTGDLLKRFLEAGLGAKTAITMVNSSLALKQDREMFSTVDLVCVDLVSGKTEFFKIGGTKSFIRHDDEIQTVFCESLPIGMLNNISAISDAKYLEEDDIIVMMSDGVCDTEFGVFTGEKMKKLLNDEEKNMSELSDAILKSALKKRNNIIKDDMTVVAIQIKAAVRND